MAAPDDGDCFLTTRKRDHVICPFDPVHSIRRLKLTSHSLKCMKNPQMTTMDRCPFDANHHVPVGALMSHLRTCPMKLLADRQANARAVNDQAACSNANANGCATCDVYDDEFCNDETACGEEDLRDGSGAAASMANNSRTNNTTDEDENWDDLSAPSNPTVPLVVSSEARQPLAATAQYGFYVDVKSKKPAEKKEIYLQLLDDFKRRNPGADGCDSGVSTASTPVPKQVETKSCCGDACAKKVEDDESVTPTPTDFGGAKGASWGPGWSSDPKTAAGETTSPRGVATSRDPAPPALGRGRGRGIAPHRSGPLAPAVDSHLQSMMAENFRSLQTDRSIVSGFTGTSVISNDFSVVSSGGGAVTAELSPMKPKKGGFGQAVLKSNLVSVNTSRCVSSVSHLGAEPRVPVPLVVPVPVAVPGPVPVGGTQRLSETRTRPADAERQTK